jgi:uncharacterized peroxidase-related enzyme
MPRLTPIAPDKAEGRAKALYEGPLAAMPLNVFKSMINAPAAVEAYLAMGEKLSGGLLSASEREIVQLAVSQANGCNYCLAAHTGLGRKAGLTADQAKDARRGVMSDPRQGALVRFALALHEKRGLVSDEDIEAFKKGGYEDGHIAEVVANYAQATFSNFFNHVNDSELDLPAAPGI